MSYATQQDWKDIQAFLPKYLHQPIFNLQTVLR